MSDNELTVTWGVSPDDDRQSYFGDDRRSPTSEDSYTGVTRSQTTTANGTLVTTVSSRRESTVGYRVPVQVVSASPRPSITAAESPIIRASLQNSGFSQLYIAKLEQLEDDLRSSIDEQQRVNKNLQKEIQEIAARQRRKDDQESYPMTQLTLLISSGLLGFMIGKAIAG